MNVTGGDSAAAVLQTIAKMMGIAARVIALGYIILSLPCGAQKSTIRAPVKYWEIIADNLSEAGFSWGCVSGVDSCGRTIFVADAHSDDGKRFVVHSDEELTAFVELESAIRQKHQKR
jgi:hypothetical protein